MKRALLILTCLVITTVGLSAGGCAGGSAEPAGAESALPSGPTEPIFVASQEIPAGQPLSCQVLKLKQWPQDQVPSGALRRIEQISGRRARVRIAPDEPVVDDKLLDKGLSGG